MTLRIGVDLGGTKTEAVALAADGIERARVRVPTPRSYEGCLDAIAALVARPERAARWGSASPAPSRRRAAS